MHDRGDVIGLAVQIIGIRDPRSEGGSPPPSAGGV